MVILGTIRIIRHILKVSYNLEAFVIYFERIALSIRRHVAIMWPSGKLLDEKLHLSSSIVYGSAAIVCGSATVEWPSVDIVFASAID